MSITELMEPTENLFELIQKLEERIEKLEQENIETTNELYRIENRLDMMDQSEYTLNNFSLGE
ncbi:hypothetical protein [Synechococcus phage DSL-LC02]|nr:hypothetical protein [Synechococcus phage DSL-LC02]